ncbi:guanine(37)-N1-methyltransferase [Choiromyces venosus 120613-1]|uniref:tRNA (guanine(37)-N1)-methyltransferase n=1 Tax=Choiromyces venosus 120613-1 TaxID=1336337 RepID=A0A3N4IY53_9PEZI|nr:guanine(37)-N1-methyltransferase [Choiromyces venosus 120613-1]
MSNSSSGEMSRLFLPPINRAMRILDPSFFQKTIPLTAAHILDGRNIPRVTRECAKDLLRIPRLRSIITQKDEAGKERKLLLMKPEVKHDDLSTVQPKTREYVEGKIIKLEPYTLHMKYENWNYEEIMNAILPENLDEIPCAFTQAGHLAHLNLREQYLPYKHLIATVLLDKNPNISTVVNKIEDVGTGSVYRTFPMELLAGEDNTNVEVRESGCVLRFDFAKVYWNSRLGNEHERIFKQFKPGEAVADVMAGVGPFAIPAAKQRVFVYANDLNPESYKSLVENTKINKVSQFLTPQNLDGANFIRSAIHALHARSQNPQTNTVSIPVPVKRGQQPPPPTLVPVPPTFSHFVMNLPASATTFLGAFRGAYRGLEDVIAGQQEMLPMIHVYTFHKVPMTRSAARDICADISRYLGHPVAEADLENLENVRLVAPNKTYYCVSFRLPAVVAFGDTQGA